MPHVLGDDDGAGYGIEGTSGTGNGSGVVGFAYSPPTGPEEVEIVPGIPKPPVLVGVYGAVPNGTGVLGQNGASGNALLGPINAGSGHTPAGTRIGAVWGDSKDGNGVYGSSAKWNGVEGDSWSNTHAGVAGQNNAGGPGVWGSSTGNAGQFEGNVLVTGNLTANDVLLSGGDCAEDFDAHEGSQIEAGAVVVFDKDGRLRPCDEPYDKRVAGVISGGGSFKPAVILDRHATTQGRAPLALVGKVYCKVDASFGAIELGDLLTTSANEGCAMKAQDPSRAFGAIIGKALRAHNKGSGLIPILVMRS